MQSQIYSLLDAWLSQIQQPSYTGQYFQLDHTPFDEDYQFADNTYQWFAAEETEVPPVPENLNFGTYAIIDYSPNGIDGKNLVYSSGTDKFTETVTSYKDVLISLNVYSVDQTAEDMINQVLLSASAQSIIDLFNTSGYSLKFYSQPRNLSEVISGRYNKRFQADLTIGAIATYSNQINRIASVPLAGTVRTPNTNININKVVNI